MPKSNQERKLRWGRFFMGLALVGMFACTVPSISYAATPSVTTQTSTAVVFVATHKKNKWWKKWKKRAVPELNAGTAAAGLALLLGGCFVLFGRKKKQTTNS